MDENNKPKIYELGKILNKDKYLDVLNKIIGEKTKSITFKELNTIIEKQQKDGLIKYYTKKCIETTDSSVAKYMFIDLNIVNAKNEKICASYYRASKSQWHGIYFNTHSDFFNRINSVKDKVTMGLIRFDDINKALAFLEDLHSRLLPGEKWEYNERKDNNHNSKVDKTASDEESFRYPILKSFIQNVYLKLVRDYSCNSQFNTDKLLLSDDNKYVLFNTGLIDKYIHDICVIGILDNKHFCIRNPQIITSLRETYKYNFTNQGQAMKMWPKMVSFFEKIDDVLFRTDIPIDKDYEQYEHIIEDNYLRFPEEYQRMYLEGNIGKISEDLDKAIENALKVAERNYKYIVPQYRPTSGKIQFLMPIYLNKDYKSSPDFALVLDFDGNYYKPETILSLETAYNNARLIAKPDDLWLDPSDIIQTDENEDDIAIELQI